MYWLNRFDLIRHDRGNGNRGGGVDIYFKKGLQYKILFKSVPSDPVEYIGVDFKLVNISKCMMISVNNPNKNNCMDKFFEESNKHSISIKILLLVVALILIYLQMAKKRT